MGKKKNLNGIPGNLAFSYLSTLGYYDGGYMADWLYFIAREKNINKIEVDILNNKIKPKKTDIKPLKVDLYKLKEILKKELSNNGFDLKFIKKAILKFEIPIDNREFKREVHCCPLIEDINGKIYKPKDKIVETAYEVDINSVTKSRIKSKKSINNWINKIRKIYKKGCC